MSFQHVSGAAFICYAYVDFSISGTIVPSNDLISVLSI